MLGLTQALTAAGAWRPPAPGPHGSRQDAQTRLRRRDRDSGEAAKGAQEEGDAHWPSGSQHKRGPALQLRVRVGEGTPREDGFRAWLSGGEGHREAG